MANKIPLYVKYIYSQLIYVLIFIVLRSQAYDAKAIQVENVPDGIVNQPVEFESKTFNNYQIYFIFV